MILSRRKFLKRFGIGVATAVTAPVWQAQRRQAECVSWVTCEDSGLTPAEFDGRYVIESVIDPYTDFNYVTTPAGEIYRSRDWFTADIPAWEKLVTS